MSCHAVEQYLQVVANISISVSVLDINDNAPVFSRPEYFIHVSPDVDENQILATITVSGYL